MLTDGGAIRERVEQGWTLPGGWYVDPGVLVGERERIFEREWQYAGLAAQIPAAGDFFTCRIGFLPVVVTRDEDGAIHAMVNVCRHRGFQVVEEECGNRRSLQCGYHAWTYNLDGRLRAAPRADRNPEFDPSGIRLPELACETLGPFIFVNPSLEAASVSERLTPWLDEMSDTGIDLNQLGRCDARRTFEFDANWKVVAENTVECYHCPGAHPTLNALMDVQSDQPFEDRGTFALYGPPNKDTAVGKDGDDGLYKIESVEAGMKASYVWPNLFFAVMPGDGMVTANVVLPLAVDRSLFIMDWYFADSVDETVRDDCLTFWDQILEEDRSLCESTQGGLSSGRFDQGRLMLPFSEPGPHLVQRLVARAMTDGDS